MKVAIVVAFMIGFVTVMTAFVVLTIVGKDTTPFVIFTGGAATTVIPQLFSLLKVHQTQSDVQSLKGDVEQVKERTNGPLDAMRTTIDDIATKVDNINEKAGE